MVKTPVYILSGIFRIAFKVLATIYVITLLPKNATFVAILATVGSGAFIFISQGWFSHALVGEFAAFPFVFVIRVRKYVGI